MHRDFGWPREGYNKTNRKGSRRRLSPRGKGDHRKQSMTQVGFNQLWGGDPSCSQNRGFFVKKSNGKSRDGHYLVEKTYSGKPNGEKKVANHGATGKNLISRNKSLRVESLCAFWSRNVRGKVERKRSFCSDEGYLKHSLSQKTVI